MISLAALGFAGDVATFQSLGFSSNGQYYMFSQYGIHEQSKQPYAEIYAVDVRKNSFVSGGVWRKQFPVDLTIGDTGTKALLALYPDTLNLRGRLGINVLTLGRPIFFRVVDERSTEENRSVKVMDFVTGRTYDAVLRQRVIGSGAGARSSFYIDLNVLSSAGVTLGQYKMGTPHFERQGVLNYGIDRMILAPEGKGLVVVVEREEDDGRGGKNIRYMVETLFF